MSVCVGRRENDSRCVALLTQTTVHYTLVYKLVCLDHTHNCSDEICLMRFTFVIYFIHDERLLPAARKQGGNFQTTSVHLAAAGHEPCELKSLKLTFECVSVVINCIIMPSPCMSIDQFSSFVTKAKYLACTSAAPTPGRPFDLSGHFIRTRTSSTNVSFIRIFSSICPPWS